MGAACEHYLYDKGYGPTNLSLKEYVSGLFPEAAPLRAADTGEGFPAVEPTLLPISDPSAETRARDADRTPPARRHEYTVAVSRPPDADAVRSRCRPPPWARDAAAPHQDPHPASLTRYRLRRAHI